MNYSAFCEHLQSVLSSQAEPKLSVTLQQIRKNNNTVFDALCVRRADSVCAPLIYLQPLYSLYRSGQPLEDIERRIRNEAIRKPSLGGASLPDFLDFDQVRERISCRLISRSGNEELLKDVPWIPFLDLAVVFFLCLESSGPSIASVFIHNHLADRWGKSADDFRQAARANMPKLFPPYLERLDRLMGKCLQTDLPLNELPPSAMLHVLTNRSGVYGSACMLCDGIIRDFSDQMEADVLILPSSIHEVLLLADTDAFSYEMLRNTVRRVNREAVRPDERLSDQLYIYRRTLDAVTIWQPASSSEGKTEGLSC